MEMSKNSKRHLEKVNGSCAKKETDDNCSGTGTRSEDRPITDKTKLAEAKDRGLVKEIK